MSQSRTRKGLLSLAQSKRECGEECCKLCVALLLFCHNHNRNQKTASTSHLPSALCGNIKRGKRRFFFLTFDKKRVNYNYKPFFCLLRFSDCALHDSTPPFLIFQEYKKAQKIGLPVVHGLLIVQFFSLARL